ncbi:hypothetical protein B0T18DRAFT_424404 [Schizothecium vesticola]|uniref:Uncharacterized protein n=1 Tax=Schizothecium vesticola TaxID=314040 RepID=A0AA40F9Y6_9PEZI|nr:hypothetical protein B0T18DRAFT_424404 [Schizothecium vesticola]
MAPVDTSNRHGASRPVPQGRPGPNTGGPAAGGSTAQRRNEESWVEVSSQPSSSSLSSLGGDEIVTTGLRVGNNAAYPPRRRRLHQPPPPQPQPQPISMPPSYVIGHAAAQAGTSSQEEYDETESEEDRLLTSSTEQVPPRQHPTTIPPIDSDTDSESATALGRPSGGSGPAFRPQPNAFSHPPSSSHRSYPRPPLANRHSSRQPRDFQADNDAALRASLTTLLSCAAAARGLPQKDDHPSTPSGGPRGTSGAGVLPSSQPMNIRLVPESELLAPTRTASNSSAPSGPASSPEKTGKAPHAHAHPQRAVKKKRTTTEASPPTTQLISPTLLTWVVSAGVVVIFSVVGFGAGYVIGREVGRQEGGAALWPSGGGGAGNVTTTTTSCGRELAKSGTGGALRRLRWGVGGGKGVAA